MFFVKIPQWETIKKRCLQLPEYIPKVCGLDPILQRNLMKVLAISWWLFNSFPVFNLFCIVFKSFFGVNHIYVLRFVVRIRFAFAANILKLCVILGQSYI